MAFFDWLKQNVWLIAAFSTAVGLYWRFLDRPQKLHERQNAEFRKVLEEKLYEKEDKDLELEIAFRYCFNRFLKAHEVRWLLKNRVSLLDLETYSRLRRNGILELNNNKINFIGLGKPLNHIVFRKFVLFILFLFFAFLVFFAFRLNYMYQNQPQQPVQLLDVFILSLLLILFRFLFLSIAILIMRGQDLRNDYNT